MTQQVNLYFKEFSCIKLKGMIPLSLRVLSVFLYIPVSFLLARGKHFKIFTCFYCYSAADDTLKLDGVGPVDNRPSTDKLHHFVKKKEKK